MLNEYLMMGLAFLAIAGLLILLGQLIMAPRRNATRTGRPLIFGALTVPLAGIVPQFPYQAKVLSRDLARAGYYTPKAREEYLALRNALALGGAILTGLVIIAAAEPGQDLTARIILAGLAITILISSFPRVLLHWQANSRVRRIQTALPDALDMITMCLTGGLPLQDALQRVGSEIHNVHPDLACELDIIRRQAEAGSLEQALRQFSQRIDIPEITSLTALVSQAQRLGTNVSTALRDYADGVRRNHRQRAEERGNTTSVKLLLPVVLCLAPPVYILLLAPALLQMREFISQENRSGGILAPEIPDDVSPLQAGRNPRAPRRPVRPAAGNRNRGTEAIPSGNPVSGTNASPANTAAASSPATGG
jgi:tight adherence protein C